MKKLCILLLFLVSLAVMSCDDNKQNSSDKSVETAKVEFKKEGELTFKRDDQVLKKLDIEVAKSSYEQQTGLMYRQSMKADRGMLFVYDDQKPRSHFYMKDTEFPLDLLYINADMTIVDFNKNAKAYDETPLPSNEPAKYVLEINAGKVDAWNLKTGDRIKLSLTE